MGHNAGNALAHVLHDAQAGPDAERVAQRQRLEELGGEGPQRASGEPFRRRETLMTITTVLVLALAFGNDETPTGWPHMRGPHHDGTVESGHLPDGANARSLPSTAPHELLDSGTRLGARCESTR